MVASKEKRKVHKPPKKKVVASKEVQKKVEEFATSTVLMPTNTRCGATGRMTQKVATSSATTAHVKKRIRKIILLSEEEEDDHPLRMKIEKQTQGLIVHSVLAGAKLQVYDLKDKAVK